MDAAKPGRDGPPPVRAVDDGLGEAAVQDTGDAQQEGGDPRGALHP